jgi:phosphoenolpyruvate carboxykinase (ATP)
MDFLKTNLESISQSLSSSYRDTGPKCRFTNEIDVIGGSLINKYESDFADKILEIIYNPSVAELYEHGLSDGNTRIVSSGALAVFSGKKTGRSPLDKRVVYYNSDSDYIWWDKESPNIKMDEKTFLINRETSICYLNSLDKVYVFDGFAGWDKEYQLKVRIISSRPYHCLFMHNMLIRPSKDELINFGDPDFTVYNAGVFPCNRLSGYMTSSTSIDFDYHRREVVILGSQYAGEMKKGIFSVMHYLMPRQNILSLHSSCNISNSENNCALFFGLSGTGKTTLSADSHRMLIGDDEHCWTDNGVFNIEGGCYAKCIGLKKESEPEIWDAIRFGTVLENVGYDLLTREVDFDNISSTENTRAAYPIDFINNAKIPCVTKHPNNIIFLTCDAFGVLPPVSKLSKEKAMYYFISGYTAKIPGTEMGVKEPIPTFSACFGEAFIVCHPSVYANLLKEKIEEHNVNVYLINTGWIQGGYGSNDGKRCPLKYTRKIVDCIHNNSINNYPLKTLPVFNIDYFVDMEEIPNEILDPMIGWRDNTEYMNNLKELASKFQTNFKKYKEPTIEIFGPCESK